MKKTFAALTLAATLAFGSTFSFAGIIISGKADAQVTGTRDAGESTCGETAASPGIIIFAATPGIIIFSAAPGIIIFASEEVCTQPTGIIISD